MKSMLVIGLGQFGRNLAKELAALDNEVLVVDINEERVEELAPFVTGAQIGDCQEESVLASLGITNYDICFVCVAGDFQASLEITSALKELGANCIISKAERERQAKILSKIGADIVIHPDMDMAERVAVKYSTKNALEYIELSDDYAIIEILTPKSWVGKAIFDLNIRNNYNINVVAYKFGANKKSNFTPIIDAKHVFVENEQLLLAGNVKDILAMTEKK